MGRRAAPLLPISQAGFVTLLFCFVVVMVLANCVLSTMEDLARCGRERAALKAAERAARAEVPEVFSIVDLQRQVVPTATLRAYARFTAAPTKAPTHPVSVLGDAAPIGERPAGEERTFLIPSFPTSGSEYVRDFFSLATGVGQGEVYGPQVGGKLLRYVAVSRKNGKRLPFFYDTKYPPPLGTATLLKTHFPLLVGKQHDADFFGGGVLSSYFYGVVLLARHPVDCVVGEHTRWGCQRDFDRAVADRDDGVSKQRAADAKAACRAERIGQLCWGAWRPLVTLARQWADFYGYWLAAADAQAVALHVVRYEDALARPERTFEGLLAFLGLPVDAARLAGAAARQLRAHPPPRAFGLRLLTACGPTEAEAAIFGEVGPAARRLGYGNGTYAP